MRAPVVYITNRLLSCAIKCYQVLSNYVHVAIWVQVRSSIQYGEQYANVAASGDDDATIHDTDGRVLLCSVSVWQFNA